MEDDPLPHFNKRGRLDCPAAIRSVTLSVPQLADAAAYFEEGIGLKPSTVLLHTPEHEALWGLPGAATHSRVFDGGEVLVEVVHYLDPVGKPWPNGYRVSDQGILNIAFGARSKPDFDAVHQRAEAFGAKPNQRPLHLPGAGVVYVNDKHGFLGRGHVDKAWAGRPAGRIRTAATGKAPRPGYSPDRTPDHHQRTGRPMSGK